MQIEKRVVTGLVQLGSAAAMVVGGFQMMRDPTTPAVVLFVVSGVMLGAFGIAQLRSRR